MKFSRHVNFANFANERKSRNLSDANNKCREHNMTRKLSDSHYVNNQERTSLLQEILQEQVSIVIFGRSPEASG